MAEQESKRDVKITGDGNIAGDDSLSQVAKIDAEKVSDVTQIHIAGDYSITLPKQSWWITKIQQGLRLGVEYWQPLLTLLLVDGALFTLYIAFRYRYLIKPSFALIIIALATIAVFGWFSILQEHKRDLWIWGLTLGFTALLVGSLIWRVDKVFRPERFSSEDFGIGVAPFGEGAKFRQTSMAENVTDQVIRRLQETIRGDQSWSRVVVKPVGLVSGSDEAREQGRRFNADLVIWGQVVSLEKDAVSIHFEVIETPDRVSSPVFPVTLPAISHFTQDSDIVLAEPEDIEDFVSRQSKIITGFSLGLAAYFNRDYGTAIEQLRKVTENTNLDNREKCAAGNDHLSLVYFYLGRSLQRIGELETGEYWLNQAACCSPDDPAIPLSIAYGHNSLGRKESANRLANQAVDMAVKWLRTRPDDVVVRYTKGSAYLLLERPVLAAEEFEIILDQRPDFYIAYLSAGRAYLRADKIEEAIQHIETAIRRSEQLGSDSSWGYLILADAYNAAGSYSKAQKFYLHAVELAPDADLMHYRLGLFYETQGEVELAEDEYEHLLQVTHDKAWGHAVLASFLRRQSRLKEAIQEYRATYRERPADTLSHIYLAELYAETGQREKALQTYQEALERTPDLEYGHVSFGNALFGWGDYSAAIEHFKSALELVPSDGVARFNLARTYEANGQRAEAISEYRAILSDAQAYSNRIRQMARHRIKELNSQVSGGPSIPSTFSPELSGSRSSPSMTPQPVLLPAPTPTCSPVPRTSTPAPTLTPSPTLPPPPTPEYTATPGPLMPPLTPEYTATPGGDGDPGPSDDPEPPPLALMKLTCILKQEKRR
jgi:tetratricopeptide (TPR) repeat protein